MGATPEAFTDIESRTLSVNEKDMGIWREQFGKSRANRVAKNAVSSAGVKASARVPEAIERAPFAFSIDLLQGERCNQERSGRCWLFASLNFLRQRCIERYNLKNIEFSQAFAMFYDKLEKCNLFLLNMIDTLAEPIEGRLLAYLLDQPMDDGGQWDMFCNIAKKYGVVLKSAMPETACSRNTGEMNHVLTRYLRSCCIKIRKEAKAGKSRAELLKLREQMLTNIYNTLVICLGEPPSTFDAVIRDRSGACVVEKTFTPQAFFSEFIDVDLDEFVSCINAPSPDKPMHTLFQVDRLGNVVEDGYVKHLNLPIDELKAAVVSQLKDGWPVWFGVDMSQLTNRDEAYMVKEAYDFDDLFGFDIVASLTKAEALEYYESAMTHAMVIEGVKLDESGKPKYWKVENSWGKDHGPNDGFEVMSDAWFDEYAFQFVLNKKYLSKQAQEVLAFDSAVLLPPWDPMGKLAQ